MAEHAPLDLMLEAYEAYLAGDVSELEYIARINICLGIVAERRKAQADPEGYMRELRRQVAKMGLIPQGS